MARPRPRSCRCPHLGSHTQLLVQVGDDGVVPDTREPALRRFEVHGAREEHRRSWRGTERGPWNTASYSRIPLGGWGEGGVGWGAGPTQSGVLIAINEDDVIDVFPDGGEPLKQAQQTLGPLPDENKECSMTSSSQWRHYVPLPHSIRTKIRWEPSLRRRQQVTHPTQHNSPLPRSMLSRTSRLQHEGNASRRLQEFVAMAMNLVKVEIKFHSVNISPTPPRVVLTCR